MGSLNGDIMVMRNGRSTSQVSVYNYPEHLNPFYEDDQHKRLRFWKISKKGSEGRRNSFSIGNLKDMWAFKSFGMKKKSSTLGINKTSESPPALRRDYVVENNWTTLDNRLRGSHTSSIYDDNFQRNATYRSSLQVLPTGVDRFALNRNECHRSTIQVPRLSPRYQIQQKNKLQQPTTEISQHNRRNVHCGSITPQPLRNTRTISGKGPYEYDSDNVMNRRSSQSSLVSSNPFESDDDETDDITLRAIRSVNGESTTTLISRTHRKKRRAPAPPTSIHGSSPPAICIESSHDSTHGELCIKEDIDIANLTAEIESFVKTKSNDDVDVDVAYNTGVQTTATKKTTLTKKEIDGTTSPSKDTSNITTTTSAIATNISSVEEENNQPTKINGQVTCNNITATTITTATNTDVTKALEKEAKVFNENVIKYDKSEQIKTNRAIPKKLNNTSIVNNIFIDQPQPSSTRASADICIKETNKKEPPQKALPLRPHTKPEGDVDQIECIYVHVESPTLSPRKSHPSSMSSLKLNETIIASEKITTKSPFVLTSPPTQKRKPLQAESEPVAREAVKLFELTVANAQANVLNINEDHVNYKPKIMAKPTASPKPITMEENKKIDNFPVIHKPMRKFSNTQNGHAQTDSLNESISPFALVQQKANEKGKSFNDYDPIPYTKSNEIKNFKEKNREATKLENMKTLETTPKNNEVCANVAKEQVKDIKRTNFESSGNSSTIVLSTKNNNHLQKRDDEFELIYRPKPTSHLEWKRSTLAPLETNIPPEKRKSVKDIIESINRSQRLLNAAANKSVPALQSQTTTTTSPVTDIISNSYPITDIENTVNFRKEKLTSFNGQDIEIQRLVKELAPTTSHIINTEKTRERAISPSPTPSNCNNEFYDNNEIFQKCKVKKEVYDYRETSPISSNLDWNPVPKPKRTKPNHE